MYANNSNSTAKPNGQRTVCGWCQERVVLLLICSNVLSAILAGVVVAIYFQQQQQSVVCPGISSCDSDQNSHVREESTTRINQSSSSSLLFAGKEWWLEDEADDTSRGQNDAPTAVRGRSAPRRDRVDHTTRTGVSYRKQQSLQTASASRLRIAPETDDDSSLCCACPTEAPTSNPTETQPIVLTCPTIASEDDDFQSMTYTLSGNINVAKSYTLCTLVKLNSDLASSFKPVARSYSGHDWEASASTAFSHLNINCESSYCSIPELPTAEYQLTTFRMPYQSEEMNDVIKARFLEQTTFGITRADMQRLSGDESTLQFAQAVQNEMTSTTMTSHRAYFRKHWNARALVATPSGAVKHPCHQYARYRRYAFTMKDSYRDLDIVSLSGNRKALYVEGQLRTIVQGPVTKFNDAGIVFEDGSYEIRWTRNEMHQLGGRLYLYHPPSGSTVRVAFNGVVGNPPIQGIAIAVDGDRVVTIATTGKVQPIDTEYHQGESETTQEIILLAPSVDAQCDSVVEEAGISSQVVFTQFNGLDWIYDGRFELLDNEVKNPLVDGGGQAVRDTINILKPEYSAICASAPRTFLTEEDCILSNAPTTCIPGTRTYAYESFDDGTLPDFYVQLTPQVLRDLYELTLDLHGEDSALYVYAIEGLRLSDDLARYPTPCTTRKSTRWIRLSSCNATALNLVPSDIRNIFEQKLSNDDDDSNPYIKWIWNGQECPVGYETYAEFEIQDDDGICWKNVHPEYWNVYDFSSWTRNHPGNLNGRNPIREFAQSGQSALLFPDWHLMHRWHDNKGNFGRAGRLYDTIHFYDLPTELRTREISAYFGFTPDAITYPSRSNTVVCGSVNEVANVPELGGSQGLGAFDAFIRDFRTTSNADFLRQKRTVWTQIALTANDQLRQRVAWALCQILVVSPSAVRDGYQITEDFVHFYDIFVRHAFGNYFDILKEVSHSALMAEMLTYYASQSTARVYEQSGNVEFADENYAREIMQLFTTGLVRLNIDGTEQKDETTGESIRVYSNKDIMEYARIWTGFYTQPWRGNLEIVYTNRIDPMRVQPNNRDVFPKMGLDRTYVGDHYPLCADLPKQHFLKAGSVYRLLGSTASPELQAPDPETWASDPDYQPARLQTTGSTSSLFAKLCGSVNPSSCTFPIKVVLDEDLPCKHSGVECKVDTLRTVEVTDGIFYEYIRPPCVYQAFYSNPVTVIERTRWSRLFCADPRTETASAACCDSDGADRRWVDQYWGEVVTFATAQERCSAIGFDLCYRERRPSCGGDLEGYCSDENHFWGTNPCRLWAKIDSEANVAIVQSVEGTTDADVHKWVRTDSKTFFRVEWEEGSSKAIAVHSSCGLYPPCQETDDGACICEVSVVESQVFSGSEPPTRDEVLSMLHIGAFDPIFLGEATISGTNDQISWYSTGTDGRFNSETIFRVVDDTGRVQFRKNMHSTVSLLGTDASFRNPVHFIAIAKPESRDIDYETDAALKQVFTHPNTAPFLTIRFAQRFGNSNPSPRFVKECASAFTVGSYEYTEDGQTVSFGSQLYGDLSALTSCVLLDREARDPILDADPSHGSFREPLLKVMGLLRSLEFQLDTDETMVDLDTVIEVKLGQMAHEIPNVFSFFLPEFQPSGVVAFASLVAPEAQILTSPRIIDTLNGLGSLIKFGLSTCFGGFKVDRKRDKEDCDNFQLGQTDEDALGKLGLVPTDATSVSSIIDELAILLTAGRLSSQSRQIINDAVSGLSDVTERVIRAQQLLVYTPEFHTLGTTRQNGQTRPSPAAQERSTESYKAFVYVMLEGGMDSFNMLAPHTCTATNGRGETLLEQYHSLRTSLAITSSERQRVIDVAGQPACTQFVVHNPLEVVERLYEKGDLAFFANTGVLNMPVDKDNYFDQSKTQLFAHNAMQREAQRIDPFDNAPGSGILGRMCDILSRENGYSVKPITVQDASIATVGVPGNSVDPLFISPYALHKFDDKPPADTFDPLPWLSDLNGLNEVQSSLFGETWSSNLVRAISDNAELLDALSEVQVATSFASDKESQKLKAIATLIGAHERRRSDRDVFFTSLEGWDHHNDLKSNLNDKFSALNTALSSFESEMQAQGRWDDVTLMIVSDFGRTLTANSGDGSDHGWGGNYFMMGGSVNGGVVHGEYPLDISPDSSLNVGRGRLIPTRSWESILNGVAEWMGVSGDASLDYCLPNREQSGAQLFTREDLFE